MNLEVQCHHNHMGSPIISTRSRINRFLVLCLFNNNINIIMHLLYTSNFVIYGTLRFFAAFARAHVIVILSRINPVYHIDLFFFKIYHVFLPFKSRRFYRYLFKISSSRYMFCPAHSSIPKYT